MTAIPKFLLSEDKCPANPALEYSGTAIISITPTKLAEEQIECAHL